MTFIERLRERRTRNSPANKQLPTRTFQAALWRFVKVAPLVTVGFGATIALGALLHGVGLFPLPSRLQDPEIVARDQTIKDLERDRQYFETRAEQLDEEVRNLRLLVTNLHQRIGRDGERMTHLEQANERHSAAVWTSQEDVREARTKIQELIQSDSGLEGLKLWTAGKPSAEALAMAFAYETGYLGELVADPSIGPEQKKPVINLLYKVTRVKERCDSLEARSYLLSGQHPQPRQLAGRVSHAKFVEMEQKFLDDAALHQQTLTEIDNDLGQCREELGNLDMALQMAIDAALAGQDSSAAKLARDRSRHPSTKLTSDLTSASSEPGQ